MKQGNRSRYHKRVLVDGTAALSGGRVYLRELLPRLLRALPDWQFVVFGAPDAGLADFVNRGQLRLESPRLPSCAGSLSMAGAIKLLWREIVFPARALLVRPDLVFTTANFFSPLLRIPVVVGLHNLVPFHSPDWYEEKQRPRRLRAWLLRRLTVDSVGRAARVIAFSNYARQLLERHGVRTEKVDLVYHGGPEGVRCWEGGDSGTLLLVSHYFRYKKIETAIRALARARAELGTSVRLVVQGRAYDGDYYASLQRLAGSLELTNQVELGRGVDSAELFRLYRSSRLLIFPAVGENCPITLLEAMAHGIPILASDCAPVPELCGPAAELFGLDDAGSCASAIVRLFQNPQRLRELSAAGQQRARSYTWQQTAQLTAQCLAAACPESA